MGGHSVKTTEKKLMEFWKVPFTTSESDTKLGAVPCFRLAELQPKSLFLKKSAVFLRFRTDTAFLS